MELSSYKLPGESKSSLLWISSDCLSPSVKLLATSQVKSACNYGYSLYLKMQNKILQKQRLVPSLEFQLAIADTKTLKIPGEVFP